MKGIEALEIDRVVEDARAVWRHASSSIGSEQLELFVKTSVRRKATRDAGGTVPSIDDVVESGVACRCFDARREVAGFAAAAGFSNEAGRWVAEHAHRFDALTSSIRPAPGSVVPERADLDPAEVHPSPDRLAGFMGGHPSIEWIEVGTTVEVLVGAGSWVACRRRNRVWLRTGGPAGQLWAMRGLDLASAPADERPNRVKGQVSQLCFSPPAAGTLVQALATSFGSAGERSGYALDVEDAPNNPLGLAGGEFDDAGFPTTDQKLTSAGYWVSPSLGPGNFWRRTYREPPTLSNSNLSVATKDPATESIGVPVYAVRVLPLQSDVWVLDLGTTWLRTDPRRVAPALVGTSGVPVATAAGPIVPSLILESSALA